ncbi:phosphatidylserine decarboxylase [Candidatus Woesearchaeota archaeon]|nr:phosphatidylserine decarboxylase [Candidatus Woesearchaeota archaeon]
MNDVLMIILLFLATAIFFAFLFYKLVFLRDPKRKVPQGKNIVSPADGKIIRIIKLKDAESLRIKKGLIGKIRASAPANCKDGFLISIMMNIFDVHVQRAPLEGSVTEVRHTKGGFKNAVYGNKFENCLENERNEITIENKEIGKIKVIQIAGLVARRIECFVGEKQKVNKGKRIGRIMLGSQVSLIIPDKAKVSAKSGDRVRAGESILAHF